METKGSGLIVQQATLRFLAQEKHVLNVSVEDGTLIVSNKLNNNASSAVKEVIIVNTDEQGDYEGQGTVEDQFDFSMEYDIVIRWAITNSTCQQANQNNSNYACRSTNSSCLHVTHGDIFMGYRCNCSSGFQGNPYIQGGCKGTSLSSTSTSIEHYITHTQNRIDISRVTCCNRVVIRSSIRSNYLNMGFVFSIV